MGTCVSSPNGVGSLRCLPNIKVDTHRKSIPSRQSPRVSNMNVRLMRLEEALLAKGSDSVVRSLETQTVAMSTALERLREEVQNLKMWELKTPPSRRNSVTSRRNSVTMRRVQSTLSDTYEFDCGVRPARSSRVSRTDTAPRSPGTDSLASGRSVSSNRPKRRHIIHQMSEIEAYGKGLNPHDPDATKVYSSNLLGPDEPQTRNSTLSCIDSVSDVFSECEESKTDAAPDMTPC